MSEHIQWRQSLEDAFSVAVRISRESRLLVARLAPHGLLWWGGHVEDWMPDVKRVESPLTLAPFWAFRARFESRDLQRGSAVIVYPDASYDVVMFGPEALVEAATLVECVYKSIKTKTLH